MIEINPKAKQDDPWDTPPLKTVEAVRTAMEAGKFVSFFRKDEDGQWVYFEQLKTNADYSDARITEWIIGKFQLRCHAFQKVVVLLPVVLKSTWSGQEYYETLRATCKAQMDKLLIELGGRVTQRAPFMYFYIIERPNVQNV